MTGITAHIAARRWTEMVKNKMVVNILVKREDEHASEKMLESLPNCPICGAKAFLERNGFGFGWSVGCPRYCLNDSIQRVETVGKDGKND